MSRIFSDLLANALTFDASDPRAGISRSIVRELEGVRDLLDDPEIETVFVGGNEVQSIVQFAVNPVAPATYILTFNLANGITFSTAAIAFNANAATVQTAVDTAAALEDVVPDYEAGDIAVTGSALSAGNLTITFSGDSVSNKQHGQTEIASTATAWVTPATVQTTPGVDGLSDEVQTINQFANNPTGGTFTLTIDLQGEDPFTTAPIAFDAIASEIETAIDVAATAAEVAGWTNSDITVAAETTDLTDGDITLTFDGGSVDELLHTLSTVDPAALVLLDPLDDPAEETATPGQENRTAWAALFAAGIFTGTLPEQGNAPSSITAAGGFVGSPHRLSTDAIKALCLQAAIDDERSELYQELLAIAGIEE
jgi:hypothetical protein